MLNVVAKFTSVMDEKGVKYTFYPASEEGKSEVVKVNYSGENGNDMSFLFFFDADGTSVSLRLFNFCKVSTEKLMDMYVAINETNAQYRWVKLYIDGDNEVVIEGDAIIDEVTAGEECFEMLIRFLSIADKIYPNLMKVLWS